MDELNRLDETSLETGTAIATHKGFPNAAAERDRTPLSLDRLLISHPISTYFFRIRGHSWHRLGIFDGDIAIIDRAQTPHENSLVISWDETDSLRISQWHTQNHLNIWGIITTTIHQF